MNIYYYCRHCQTTVGSLPLEHVDLEQLGLSVLSDSDQNLLLSSDGQGHLYVSITCEHCEESFLSNPALHGYDYIIQ
ncbi:anti-sigma-F factor Fin [Bacillus sp. 1P06AnD]|uniref:anti-sigma-F factor Fin n=1 Tax=Bacillus sp. 1P06AnD TaxID=3132208 RepID=UPI0039A27ABB